MGEALVFIVLGAGFLLLQGRIAKLERTMKQVVDEVQRQRDVLAGKRPADPNAEFAGIATEPARSTGPAMVARGARPATVSAPVPVADVAPETPAPPSAPGPAAVEATQPAPEPGPTPAPVPEPAAARAAPPRIAFEELLGSKLPIWAGGVTLAVAGFFIVKYSIDTGLLSPAVRVVFALIFAAALVAGGEFARRWRATAIDPRVAQALAGAGVATAYAAILMTANLYGLIPPVAAFVGLALVTAGAMGLALRFGPPSAVLGLVGGLAAPALVGGEGSIATLAIYLALAITGLAGLARQQKWRWLAALALAGGFGWGAVMLVMQAVDLTASLSIGAYLVVLAFLVPIVAGRDAAGLIRLVPPAIAAGQMAILIVQGGYAPLVWGFYGLLAVGTVVLARIDGAQRLLPPMAAAVGVAVLAIWPAPPLVLFATILILGTILFAGDAALRVLRGDVRDAALHGGVLLAAFALGWFKVHALPETAWAAIAFGLALIPAILAAQLWKRDGTPVDLRFVVLATTAIILADAGLSLTLDRLWWGPAMAGIAALTVFVARRGESKRLADVAALALVFGLMAMVLAPSVDAELARVFGDTGAAMLPWSLLRIALAAAATAAFARFEPDPRRASSVQALAALVASCALAQVVPAPWLAVANVAAALVLTEFARRRATALLPAIGTFSVVGASWTLWPLLWVAGGALTAMTGVPLFVTALPLPMDALTGLIAPGALLALLAWRIDAIPARAQRVLHWTTGLIGAAGLFVLWKHIFFIDAPMEFIERGMAERVALTTLLFAAAAGCWRLADRFAVARSIARVLFAAAAARILGFDVLLYNPLWVRQLVGAWPVANLLAPAYLLPLLWMADAAQREPPLAARAAPLWTAAQMILVLTFAATSVRQVFHGSVLDAGGVSAGEDIVRSLVAIAIALGFLAWGIRVKVRAWRIASLVLMLAAIAKVFLFDASGLEGLLRIGSFAALGLSLIGVGWVYSRYLAKDAAPTR